MFESHRGQTFQIFGSVLESLPGWLVVNFNAPELVKVGVSWPGHAIVGRKRKKKEYKIVTFEKKKPITKLWNYVTLSNSPLSKENMMNAHWPRHEIVLYVSGDGIPCPSPLWLLFC